MAISRNKSKPAKKVFYYSKYLRKSSEEEDSRSIHNQDSVLDAEIQKIIDADVYNDYVYVDTYCDEDYTGTDSERPDFKRLLRDISSGKVNMIVVTDLSRLSRNITESTNYVQVLFVALGVRFISIQLPALDSYLDPNKVYSLEVPMHGMFNENHAAETSFKVRRTFDNEREQGKFIGAFAGYGWKKDPEDRHKLLLDQEPYEVMQMMKEWVFDGASASMVKTKLNDLGIPSPAGYKKKQGMKFNVSQERTTFLWSAEMVKRLMLRPENVGDLVQGRYRVISYKVHKKISVPENEWFICEDAIPAIYTREEQRLITDALKKRTRVSPTNKKQEVYLFSGFLKCGDCGKGMTRITSKNHVYYACNTYKKYGPKACASHMMKHETLESTVLLAIQNQIRIAVDMENVLQKVDKAPLLRRKSDGYDKSIREKSKELSKIQLYKTGLYEDWKNGDLTQSEYRQMKSKYIDEEEKLISIIANLEDEKKKLEKIKDKKNPFLTEFRKHQNLKKLSRDILIELVDRITIHKDNNITIHFKFADDYKRIVDCLNDCADLVE